MIGHGAQRLFKLVDGLHTALDLKGVKQRDDKIRDQAAGEDYHDDVPDTLRDMAQQAGYGRVDEVDRRKAAEPPDE